MRYRPTALLLVLICTALGCAGSRSRQVEANAPLGGAESNAPPRLTIFVNGGRNDQPRQSLVLAAWEDGRVVWSGDQVRGGSPLFTANLSEEARTQLFARLDEIGIKTKRLPRSAWFGPDSSFTVIRYRDSRNAFELWSWHEIFESRPTLVASSFGIEPLNGRRREDVIAASTEEYRQFREVWQEIRNAVRGVLPASARRTAWPTPWSPAGGSVMSRDEAKIKARWTTDGVASGLLLSDCIRVRGAWKFMAYSAGEAAGGGHFFVLVFDDGAVELEGGL